jgi:ADP-dependent NAD(P)H-hydrate dehydratase
MSPPLHPYISPSQFQQVFNARAVDGNKGSFGSVAIIGGAKGMTGAAVLAARMALKAGAGRVYVGLAQTGPHLELDAGQPEIMWRDALDLPALAQQITAWGLGCGLSTSVTGLQCIKTIFGSRLNTPIVLDADALNALSRGDLGVTWGSRPVILTPHPGEAARLLQVSIDDIQSDRVSSAQTLARKYDAWVVLKGHHSIVCNPAGAYKVNTTGNVALASAGTGDILTGLITSLLAQGFDPEQAVCAGVWMHGTAAERLTRQLGGTIGVTASELIDVIRVIRNQG